MWFCQVHLIANDGTSTQFLGVKKLTLSTHIFNLHFIPALSTSPHFCFKLVPFILQPPNFAECAIAKLSFSAVFVF